MRTFRRALVTGASSGIGLSLARELAADGVDLVVSARSTDRLNALAAELAPLGVNVEVLTADLAVRSEVDRVADRIRSETDPIDLVVNNAGLGFDSSLLETDLDQQRNVVDVNVTALHDLSIAAAQTLAPRGAGGILNVSSIAGWLHGPNGATYAATKAFVTSMSRSLHAELAPSGVAVTALCPGFTRTEFQDRAGYDASDINDRLWQSADTVARAGLDAVARGDEWVVPGPHNRLLAAVARNLPAPLFRAVNARIAASS